MVNQELVEIIAGMVLQQLQKKEKGKKQVLILGELDCHYAQIAVSRFASKGYDSVFFEEADESVGWDSFEHIVVPYLKVESIVNIAVGVSSHSFEKFMISCIMRNRKIVVLNSQMDEITQACNPSFYEMLLEYKKKLEGFQVVQCSINDVLNGSQMKEASFKDLTSKKLITENDISDVESSGVIKISNALITPLAQDRIREKKVKII